MSSIIKRRKTANYTQINNLPIQEDIKDLAAIGLLTFIFSLPETWILRKSHLHNHFSRRTVDTAWKKLLDKKYVIGFYCHVNGHKQYFYNVSDIPFNQDDMDLFVTDNVEALKDEDNTVYNIEPIKDSSLDIPDFYSNDQNVQYETDSTKGTTNKEIKTKEISSNKYSLPIVNKDNPKPELISICNQFYTQFANGRWSKQQWTTLINRFVDEMIASKKHLEVKPNKITGYIYKALENIAYKHDLKNPSNLTEYQKFLRDMFEP